MGTNPAQASAFAVWLPTYPAPPVNRTAVITTPSFTLAPIRIRREDALKSRMRPGKCRVEEQFFPG
jgi:hypothetical protein